MYAQLGTTVFDATQSFVSFSDDEEAVIVEHALIGRKAKLQPIAIGLRNISISLFLHQEFCKVTDEINKLRNSKNTFEILPLLWGSGLLEGEFLITTMGHTKTQMDSLGNTIAATVSLSLKENVTDNKLTQQQQQAQTNAFAVGNKKQTTKSTRVNPSSCQQQVSNIITLIKGNAGNVDIYSRQYTNNPATNNRIKSHLNIININASKLVDASATSSSCVYGVSNFGANANTVKLKASGMLVHIQSNIDGFINPLFIPNLSGVKADNDTLQAAVKSLVSSANKVLKSSIVKK